MNKFLAIAPLRLWAIIAAAPVLTAGAGVLVYIVWRGGWPASLAAQQLNFLGWSLMIVLLLIGVIITALTAVKVHATGVAGTSLSLEGDDDTFRVTPSTPAQVTITATATGAAAPTPPAKPAETQ